MNPRNKPVVLLALSTICLVLLFSGSVSAQEPIDSSILRQASQQQGLAVENLEIASLEETNLPVTGVSFHQAKVIDRTTGNIYGYAVNAQGSPVDAEAARLAEKAAYRARYGNLQPALYDLLQNKAVEDKVQVGVWLKAPDLSEPARPVLKNPPTTLQDGKAALWPVIPDRAAITEAREKTPEEVAAGLAALQAGEIARQAAAEQQLQAQQEAVYRQTLQILSGQAAAVETPFVAGLRAQGYEPVYVSPYAPLVYYELPKQAIQALSQRADVDAVYGPINSHDMMDSARPTQKGDWVTSWGYDGSGVNVALLEDSRIEFTNPYIPDGVTRDMGGATDQHSAATAGMVASTHGTYHGIASGVSLFSANAVTYTDANLSAAMDWSVSQGVNVINNSWGGDDGTTNLNVHDRHLDYIVRNTARTVPVAAGNAGSGCEGTGRVSSPARGYNVISVGNYMDNNTLTWAGDAMDTCSSWVNPATNVEKPELAAVGSSITSTTNNPAAWIANAGSGTSYAAPMVSGLSALLMQRDTIYKSWPETVKALLMTTALHNIEGSTILSDYDGAGGVDMAAAFHTADTYSRASGTFIPSNFPLNYYFYAYAGETVRAAIAWDSAPSDDYTTDPMNADLDMSIFNPSGDHVISSASVFRNYEIVEFTAAATGTYNLRVTAYRFDGASEFVGAAWWVGHRAPSTYTPQTWGTPPVSNDYYRIAPVTTYWHAFGTRSPAGADYDIYLYPSSAFANPSEHTLTKVSASTAPVDFILIDSNHAPTVSYYPEIYKYSTTGGNYATEWAGYAAVAEGTYGSYTMTPSSVIRVWDDSVITGIRKYYAIRPTSGDADLGMALYASNGASSSTWYQSRSQSILYADSNGAGAAETMNYLPSASDWLGLVAWNNGATSNTPFYLYVDTSAPTGSLSINNGAAATNDTAVTLNLAGVDAQTGVYQMRLSNNGTTFSAWEPYVATKGWNITSGDGTKTVFVQYKNNAEMVSGTISDTIVLDTVVPTGSILTNGGAAYTNSLTVTLTLSASDDRSGIWQMRNGNYLLPWGPWEAYATSKSWGLDPTGGDGEKRPYVQYRDVAGNLSAQYYDAIILDTTPPSGTISINGGAAYTSSPSVTLALSATDALSGMGQMRFSNDGSSFTAWEPYATSKAWSITTTDGAKTVYVQYRDAIGNPSSSFTDNITLDSTPPAGTIVINSGEAYTNHTAVALTLSATDALSGVSQMRFSNNGSAWTAWEPYAASKAWTITTGDGTKTVYVQYSDVLGNGSTSFTDTIVLDTAGPSGSIQINAGDGYTNVLPVTVNLNATDTGSGVASMSFSEDGSSWSLFEPYAATKAWMLPNGDGLKTVYVKYRDNLDNVSSTFSDSILLDTIAPTATASSPAETLSLAFTVSWTGDDGLSGVASFDVQYREGPGGAWTPWLTDTGATSAVFGPALPVGVVRGQTYYFRIRARDHAGNLGDFPGGDGNTSTLVSDAYPLFLPVLSK